jgi:hypothetical protein
MRQGCRETETKNNKNQQEKKHVRPLTEYLCSYYLGRHNSVNGLS